jgi:hypothetical protein
MTAAAAVADQITQIWMASAVIDIESMQAPDYGRRAFT